MLIGCTSISPQSLESENRWGSRSYPRPSPEKVSWRSVFWRGGLYKMVLFLSRQYTPTSKAGSIDPQRWFWAILTTWPLICGAWAASWLSCTQATLCSPGRMKWSSWPASWRWGGGLRCPRRASLHSETLGYNRVTVGQWPLYFLLLLDVSWKYFWNYMPLCTLLSFYLTFLS